MFMAKIARVTLDLALGKEFDYHIPSELAALIEVGTRVKVPFSKRQVLGCVTALAESSPHPNLRSILQVTGRQSHVSPIILRLARWMSQYYCCPAEIALKTVLPEAVRKEKEGWREQLFVRALSHSGPPPKLSQRQEQVLELARSRGELSFQELLKVSGASAATVRRLEDKGLISIAPQISERDPYAREIILPSKPLSLNADQARALQEITNALSGSEKKSEEAANALGGTGVSPAFFGVPPKPSSALAQSNSSGQKSVSSAAAPLAAPPVPPKASRVFLLHGVTGSGKTEVYLQAIALTLDQGKGAIVLVPEISLTPQTVERFKARFSAGACQTLVAVLHSHLSQGERHDEWQKIRQGRARIVIGARSAIFAPVERLGLIIVDEEHEYSYKQEEAPRYQARDVAVVRAQMEEAVVVLGSATPSMESFYNARKGKYRLLELPARADDKKMPVVRVVDMRQVARREKGTPIFSPLLKEAVLRRLERNEQTFLFINRRGFATSLQCPLCGYVAQCPNCSVALTYHRQEQTLRCHVCDHLEPAPAVCPDAQCRNPAIRYAGLGTQRVESALAALFPKARIRRMDSDALKRKEDYRRILGDVRTGKIDILVGTQMIAKGLHFPNVTLVGIIHADLSLHLPDFRAGERTFQLLTQVAGRAGRGEVEGEVVVQAFTPFHPAIQFARRHDFNGFYEQEMEFRRQLGYPPLTRMALLLVKGRNDEKVKFSADYVKAELARKSGAISDLITAGPAPAPLARAKTNYRYQIMLRTRQITRLSALVGQLANDISLPEGVSMTVDVDPVNLM
jgi:primosomal protein N' (replication factor Y)